ncbi:RNase P subunit p30 family protein [Methanoregula sp.]|uniref:RNase P subunit p30 family protein n=1 Tax=Methanoregula sp. TaxID=2052170 RepID=UPI0035672607
MKITDAAVFVHPSGDSSVRRMALEAKALGFDSIVAIDAQSCEYEGITVCSGRCIRDHAMRDVIARVKQARTTDAVISVQAGDNGFNRAALGLKGVHILRGIQSADKTAFDHVAAKMAADNRVAVDLDLSILVSARGIARQRVIHRYLDILVLEQRFEFPLTISSQARSILDMRSVREITGLCSLLGMDTDDVARALGGIGLLDTPAPAAVRVIG